ncbi:hypothetical protein [Nannocystis radixulma]|uniref:Uncharacterized protein n=1 Tax=Nannocystis radixulma TaxID=2995305 RepID=A0ABT5BPV2_9BACT|nr:hypothetical protein [Nannocystis radixulma]MDC0675022.1 hypothetical protein [Nannocystis radixulma]
MPRARLLLRALAFTLPLFGAVLTPPAITLGTCGEQVERMRGSFAELEQRIAHPHAQREGWPLAVSSAGQPMHGAEYGAILYGPPSDDEWPDLARDVERLENQRRMWEGWGSAHPPEPIYLALRSDVKLDKHWPALRRLAREWELRLVVASPEPALPRPAAPEALREALERPTLTAEAGFDRLEELRDVWAAADTCPVTVHVCTQFGFGPRQMLGLWIDRAEACHCFMIDEEALIAVAWRAFAPQGPPQRWLPLKIADSYEEQRRAEREYGASPADPDNPTAMLLPGAATVERLVTLLTRGTAPTIHFGTPNRGPLFNPLVDYTAWANGKGRR